MMRENSAVVADQTALMWGPLHAEMFIRHHWRPIGCCFRIGLFDRFPAAFNADCTCEIKNQILVWPNSEL